MRLKYFYYPPYCPEGAFVWQTFKKSMSVRPSACVREKRTFHRSQRARVTWFLRPYTRRRGKSSILGPSILSRMVWNPYQAFLKRFFLNKILSFIYTSQKSRLTHFVTKRVLVDTDKTLIISYFWPFWRLSDPSDVGLTYPIWTQLQTFERFPHKSPFGATLAPRV